MTARRTIQELIGCHDCGGNVSFSALACPHCGSREPAGPYVQSVKEQRLHRIEEKNDQTLIGMTVLCAGIGFFYGSVMIGAVGAFGYGLLGAMIGVPAGFIINASRRLFG
ncbi:hypothetical protein [Bradyrhizobium zhanjiangense]|uniref:hypothetical protein n=1 Tax=Bradyrhizobium zhanjiangense TaxID=1325107 RepID=UPI0019D717BF|nr:hypothetical protein [Bradyrhizobium zhanjiangense]